MQKCNRRGALNNAKDCGWPTEESTFSRCIERKLGEWGRPKGKGDRVDCMRQRRPTVAYAPEGSGARRQPGTCANALVDLALGAACPCSSSPPELCATSTYLDKISSMELSLNAAACSSCSADMSTLAPLQKGAAKEHNSSSREVKRRNRVGRHRSNLLTRRPRDLISTWTRVGDDKQASRSKSKG
eukprot:2528754-Pleurochrysis_carterae.AAC.2